METGIFISKSRDMIKSVIEIDKNHADLLTDVINEANDKIPVINKIEKDSKGNEKVFNIIIIETKYMTFEDILYFAFMTELFHYLVYENCKKFYKWIEKIRLEDLL